MNFKLKYQFEPRFKICPACHSTNISAAFKSPDGVMCVKGFSIDSCARCGLHFVNPQPTLKSLAQFYEKLDDTLITDLRKCNSAYYRKKLFADLIQPMKKHIKKGKILDFGCGLGLFVKALQEQGYESYGIDHSERSIQTGREKLHLKNLTCGRLEDYRPSKLFDCVTAVAVLEHLKDPKQFIKNAHRQLKKNGLLFLRFPSADSLQFKALGRFYNWIQTPYHLYYFTLESIKRMLEHQGFQITEVYPVRTSWHWARSLANSLGFSEDYLKWRKRDPKFIEFTIELDRMLDKIAYDLAQPSIAHVFARKK